MTTNNAPDDQPRAGTATPFLIALAIAVVAIVGLLTWNVFNPASDRLSDSAQISRTIGQYYGALNHGRYADLVANTCAKDRSAPDFPKEAGFADARKAAVEKEGEVNLDENGVKDLQVTGDSATARLTLKYGKGEDRTENAKFVREDDKWKKCS